MIWLGAEFNSLDDEGRVLVLSEDAPKTLAVGERVYLFDDEGNRCQGVVALIGKGLIHVDADWDTWRQGSPPTEAATVVVSVEQAHELALV